MTETIFALQIASPTLGFIGTVLLFIYGIPKQIDTGGKISLILEQEDEEEKEKIKKYKRYGNIGLILIAIGFIIDFILVFIDRH